MGIQIDESSNFVFKVAHKAKVKINNGVFENDKKKRNWKMKSMNKLSQKIIVNKKRTPLNNIRGVIII